MADCEIYELQCFVNKVWSLRNAGQSACLTIESRDYELQINLQLNLPHPGYPRPGPRPRPSPTRARRRARRAAAATDKVVQPDLPVHIRADAAVQADQCVSPPPPPPKPTHPTATTLSTACVDAALQAGQSVQEFVPPLRVGVTPLLP